ncbi:hypothetical protein, partial [Escherichia coli]
MSIKVEGEKVKVEGESSVHTALVGQINDLKDQVTGFQGQITTLTADKAKLTTDLGVAQARITELEGQLASANKSAEEAVL